MLNVHMYLGSREAQPEPRNDSRAACPPKVGPTCSTVPSRMAVTPNVKGTWATIPGALEVQVFMNFKHEACNLQPVL